MSNRIEFFEQMIANDPGNTMVLFGLANEYLKNGDLSKGIATLEEYIGAADDEGAAYGMLSKAYEETGESVKARDALQKGIEIALAHGHPTMAQEFEARLDDYET